MADYYLDLSLASGGTGAFATPWGRIANITGVVPGDIVWCRRTTLTETTQAPGYGLSIPDSVPLVGWPISGDTRFSARPIAARATWDPDAGTHATIIHNPPATGTATTNANVATLVPEHGKTYILSRFRLRRNCVGAGVNGLIGNFGTEAVAVTTRNFIFVTERCSFEVNQNTGTFASGYHTVGTYSTAASTHLITTYNWTDLGSTFLSTGTSISGTVMHLGTTVSGGYNWWMTLNASFSQTTLQVSGANNGFVFLSGGTSLAGWINGTFDRCVFDQTSTKTSQNFWYNNLPMQSPNGIVFSRCTFSIVPGTNGFNRFDTGGFLYFECDWLGFNSLNISDPSARVSIRKFAQGTADTTRAALNIGAGGSYVTVGNATFTVGAYRDVEFVAQTVGPTPQDVVGGGTVHFRSVTESGSGNLLRINGRIIAQDINGAVGTWKRTTLVGVAQVVPGYRAGGARYAIQLLPALLPIAEVEGCPTEEPGYETLRVPLQPGSNTVTVYCAHVGYGTAPTAKSVWLEVEAPLVTSRLRVSTRNYAGGALTADSSAWNGVSGSPTFFKLVATVVVDTQCVGFVRVYAGDGNGSVFVDPKPVVS